MSGVVESAPGSGEPTGGTAPIETTPGSGGLADVSSSSDSPFSLSDEIMNSDFEEVEVPATQVAGKTEPEAPADGTAKPGEVKVEPKAAEAKPAAPEVKPEAKPGEVKPVVEETKPSAAQPSVSLLEQLSQNREQLISHLAETRFKPTKEESDLLDVDATAGIAKIAARVYYEAATTTMQQLQNFIKDQLPALIDGHTQTNNHIRDAEDAFYREHPNLSKETDDATVRQYATIYRQANPQASRKEAIEKVGLIVSTVLGKPKVGAQVASPKTNGQRPFTPASGVARVVSQVPVPETSPFAGMGQDFDG